MIKLTQEARETLMWGTYGITGRDPLKYVAMKDMSHNHLAAILCTQRQITDERRSLYMQELFYRAANNIVVVGV